MIFRGDDAFWVTNIMFSGLMSLWMIFLLWQYWHAERIIFM